MKKNPSERAELITTSLNCKDEYWYGVADAIDKANNAIYKNDNDRIRNYFNIIRDGEVLKNGTGTDYFESSLKLFRATVEIQKTNKTNNQLPDLSSIADMKYDVLITLVGFSPQPLMHTVLTLQPVKIYLVTSEQSEHFEKSAVSMADFFKFLVKKYDQNYSNICCIEQIKPVNEIGSVDTFKKTRELIQTIRKEKPDAKIAIDITGGKKSMDASAFLMAAVEKDIDIFYVDFQGYGEGKPTYGTEFLNKLDNPYQLYNIREEELLRQFWERKDYAQADVIVSEVLGNFSQEKAEDYGLTKERERYSQIQEAAKCYAAWSDFNYELARHHTNFDFYREHQQNVLSDLMPCPDKRKTAKGAIYLAADRWMRGNDFLEKDLDKAALCFTQVIEVLSKFRLKNMCSNNPFNQGSSMIEVNLKQGLTPDFDKTYFISQKLIDFLFVHESLGKNPSQLDAKGYSSIKWKDTSYRFDNTVDPSYDEVSKALYIRNNLSHFNCFSDDENTENQQKVEKLKDTSKKYIQLFITTYKNEMVTEAFDDIKAKLQFAEFEHFSIGGVLKCQSYKMV